MYIPCETVRDNLDSSMTEDGESRFRIVLGEDDTAWSPDGWSEEFQGPGRATYRRSPNGVVYAIWTIEK